MPYGKDGEEIKPGSIRYIWDDEKKIREFKDRIRRAKAEIQELPEGRKHITFLAKRGYNTPRPLNQRILYKDTVDRFNSYGHAIYKSDLLTVKQGRIVTSLSEEIAFLDMHKGYMRQEDRPLNKTEQAEAKNLELQAELDALKMEKVLPKDKVKDAVKA